MVSGVAAHVASVSHSVHVVGLEKQLQLTGTVGIATAERVKVGSCFGLCSTMLLLPPC